MKLRNSRTSWRGAGVDVRPWGPAALGWLGGLVLFLSTASAQPGVLEDEPLLDEPAPTPQATAAGGEDVAPAPAQPAGGSPLELIAAGTPLVRATSLKLIEEGRTHLARGEKPQAIELYERAIEVDPNNAVGYFFLGQMYFEQQQYDQANAFAGRAVNLGAALPPRWQSRLLTLQGQVMEAIGRFAQARRAYEHALQLNGSNAVARTALGRLSE